MRERGRFQLPGRVYLAGGARRGSGLEELFWTWGANGCGARGVSRACVAAECYGMVHQHTIKSAVPVIVFAFKF
jgi:hypothetical protein